MAKANNQLMPAPFLRFLVVASAMVVSAPPPPTRHYPNSCPACQTNIWQPTGKTNPLKTIDEYSRGIAKDHMKRLSSFCQRWKLHRGCKWREQSTVRRYEELLFRVYNALRALTQCWRNLIFLSLNPIAIKRHPKYRKSPISPPLLYPNQKYFYKTFNSKHRIIHPFSVHNNASTTSTNRDRSKEIISESVFYHFNLSFSNFSFRNQPVIIIITVADTLLNKCKPQSRL